MYEQEISLIPQGLRQEMELRLRNIQAAMMEAGIKCILVASNANIYYTAGRFFRGYVFIPAQGHAVRFVIRPDIYEKDEFAVAIRKPEQIVGELERRGISIQWPLGLEQDVLSWSDCKRLAKAMGASETDTVNASGVLRHVRQVKTPYELAKMREDGVHQAEAYRKVTRLYKKDMTDVEFQVEIERVLRLEGNLGFLRVSGNLMEINMGSVIAGANADAPSPYDFAMGGAGADASMPCGANGEIMKPGETVMVDMNGSFNGYQTDMTRVWRLGEVDSLAVKAHECSRKILRTLESLALPGTEVRELYDRAMAIVAEDGLDDYFMGHRQHAAFIGHGVGIELNETPAVTPKCREKLRAGMTLALEPKFVIPGTGAVGVENTYVVGNNGLECITDFPEEMQNLL